MICDLNIIVDSETIKKDILNMKDDQFYRKYLIPPTNWYFYMYGKKSVSNMQNMLETFQKIISETLSISHKSSFIVGSAKLGYSLAPYKPLRPFREPDNNGHKEISDIDIAIISTRLFDNFWYKLRTTQKLYNQKIFNKITYSIYNGYINGSHVNKIDRVRSEWLDTFSETTQKLQYELQIISPINYRVYRCWEDFEQYHLKGISQLRQKISNNQMED
jgi:hypothetical protein